MFILTDSMRGLLAELASAGHMEVEMDGERLRVTVDCGSPKKEPKVRNAISSRPAPKEPAKPRFGRKPGRKPAPRYKKVNGCRCRVFAYNGEELTTQEWARRYGTTTKAIESRFRLHGSPETVRNRSKSDRTSLKARLGGAK